MRRRKEAHGVDPALKNWKASLRAQNFGRLNSPLCVRTSFLPCEHSYSPVSPQQLAAVGALLEHLVRVNAANDLDHEGVEALDVRDIEIVALWGFKIHQQCMIQLTRLRSISDQVMQINADAL